MPYLLFLKKQKLFNYRLLQIIGGALRVKKLVLEIDRQQKSWIVTRHAGS